MRQHIKEHVTEIIIKVNFLSLCKERKLLKFPTTKDLNHFKLRKLYTMMIKILSKSQPIRYVINAPTR